MQADEEIDTFGGLIFSSFSALPKDGEQPETEIDGLRIRVERIEEHRIESALVSKLEPVKEQTAEVEKPEPGKKENHDGE